MDMMEKLRQDFKLVKVILTCFVCKLLLLYWDPRFCTNKTDLSFNSECAGP